jgi:hypothetical protein
VGRLQRTITRPGRGDVFSLAIISANHRRRTPREFGSEIERPIARVCVESENDHTFAWVIDASV